MSHFLSHLQERQLVAQVSHLDELQNLMSKGAFNDQGKRYALYCGVDPTAPSIHIGNMAALFALRRAQKYGFTPIVVFGGATGLIGDPTGRTELRGMKSPSEIAGYIENFKKLVRPLFDYDVENPPIFLNNIDWIGGITWLEFLREVGIHFTVPRLLSAEVNKSRLEHGLTFMEMGYQLLQAYDFLHLYRHYNCVVQVGGNDQWSNILAGADLIRRVEKGQAFALTIPLLVGSDGRKYGKTAGNAIWLDAGMTSAYEFFQFFRNIPDLDVELFLRFFSTWDVFEIRKQLESQNINAVKQSLATEVTELVHGQAAAQAAVAAAQALFDNGGDFSQAPATLLSKSEVDLGVDLMALLIRCDLCKSRSEARKLIEGSGLTYNSIKVTDAFAKVKAEDFMTPQGGIVLRKGKKDFHIVRMTIP